jgi:hypothetical protein
MESEFDSAGVRFFSLHQIPHSKYYESLPTGKADTASRWLLTSTYCLHKKNAWSCASFSHIPSHAMHKYMTRPYLYMDSFKDSKSAAKNECFCLLRCAPALGCTSAFHESPQEGGAAPRINFGTRCGWVANITHQAHLPPEKNSGYPLNRRQWARVLTRKFWRKETLAPVGIRSPEHTT